MRNEGEESKHTPAPPKKSTVVLLLGTIADTTWRMFLPVIIGVALGIWLDRQFAADPWFALLGVLGGSTIAALLIKKQLREVNK